AAAGVRRQVLQPPRVAAADDDVLRQQRLTELLHRLGYLGAPLPGAVATASVLAEVVFVDVLPRVAQVPELHRLDRALDDERGAQARSQPEEEQPAALVVAQRLHRRVVDDLHRAAERRLEIEADPARAEVVRLACDDAVAHHARIADRQRVVAPAARDLQDALHHVVRRHARPGLELDMRLPPARQAFDVGAADVEYEDPRPPLRSTFFRRAPR